MLFTASLVSLAAVPAVFGAAFPIVNMKRGAVSGATWFAYGNGISGMPVLYNTTDGLLYISASNATASNLVSVTWDAPAITAALTTTTNATLLNGTLAGSLYAVTSSGSYDPAGIVPSTGLNSSINATTLGFGMFGSQVVLNSAGSILASFYAKTVSDDVWALEWNSDNTDSDDATPVAINTNAPAIPATQVAEDAKGNS